jgi:hypothetical protein
MHDDIFETISTDHLTTVSGGLTIAQANREAGAVTWASKQLHTPTFLGNANGSAGGPTLSNRGVLVSTGEAGPVRHLLGHVTFNNAGKPVHLNVIK